MSRLVSKRFAALARFARAQRGAIAVEFALIALPFLILLFGVIELGMVLMASTTLDTAMEFSTRNIRTGVFQTSGTVSNNAFKTMVCNNMSWLKSDCASKLTVESETFNDFAGVAGSNSSNPNTFDPNTPKCWSVGKPGDIVLVRAYYEWKLFTPLLDRSLQNRGDGKRLLVSTSAFRNEPYSNEEKTGAKCS